MWFRKPICPVCLRRHQRSRFCPETGESVGKIVEAKKKHLDEVIGSFLLRRFKESLVHVSKHPIIIYLLLDKEKKDRCSEGVSWFSGFALAFLASMLISILLTNGTPTSTPDYAFSFWAGTIIFTILLASIFAGFIELTIESLAKRPRRRMIKNALKKIGLPHADVNRLLDENASDEEITAVLNDAYLSKNPDKLLMAADEPLDIESLLRPITGSVDTQPEQLLRSKEGE